jgi:hypothetical protein
MSKDSFFARFFRGGEPNKQPVSSTPMTGAPAPRKDGQDAIPSPQPRLIPPTLVKQISRKEETALRIADGITDLNALVRGVGQKLDAQKDLAAEVREGLKPIRDLAAAQPAAFEQQAGLVRGLTDQVRSGNQVLQEMATSLRALPELLRDVPEAQRMQVHLLGRVLEETESQGSRIHKALTDIDGSQRESADAIRGVVEQQKQGFSALYKAQKQAFDAQSQQLDKERRDLTATLARAQRNFSFLLVGFLVVTLGAVSLAVFLKGGGARPADRAGPSAPAASSDQAGAGDSLLHRVPGSSGAAGGSEAPADGPAAPGGKSEEPQKPKEPSKDVGSGNGETSNSR